MAIASIAGVGYVLRKSTSTFYSGERGTECEGAQTATSVEQIEVEDIIQGCVTRLLDFAHRHPEKTLEQPMLLREKHVRFLLKSMRNLPQSYQVLDASGPWLCYWIVHSLNLLNVKLEDSTRSSFVRYLKNCEHPDGGYGGAPLKAAHLAPTYGAVSCLVSLGTEEAYSSIDRRRLLLFLLRMRQPDGSFVMHDGGEVDIRGSYCALAVARLTNILKVDPRLTDRCAEFLLSCQTYEGGFGGLPGLEAHGGYSFCGVAALAILGAEGRCNLHRLLHWLIMRQCPFEGGFNGRTNKLVDGCYSFWQGGAVPIVYRALSREDSYSLALPKDKWLFNQRALQEYILTCCQAPTGGLIDKPGKPSDFYHTCYVLSGLSIAQHFEFMCEYSITRVGGDKNLVEMTDPVQNVREDCLRDALRYFRRLPAPSI